MNSRDCYVLTALRKVNGDMGTIVLRLMRDMPNGALPADKLRELAAIFDDLARLLANRASEVDPADAQPLVVEGGTE